MSTSAEQRLPAWAAWFNVVPVLAAVLLGFTWGRDMPGWVVAIIGVFLFGDAGQDGLSGGRGRRTGW
jgi:Ca2+:H+ antiporter